jgi:hypothetical protein
MLIAIMLYATSSAKAINMIMRFGREQQLDTALCPAALLPVIK